MNKFLYTSPDGSTLNKSTEDLMIAVDKYKYDVLKPDYSSFGDIHKTIEIRLVSKSDIRKRTVQVTLGKLRSNLIKLKELNQQIEMEYAKKRDESILARTYDTLPIEVIVYKHKGEDDSVIVAFDTEHDRLGYYTRENGKGVIVLVNTREENQMVATLIHEYIHAWADKDATGGMNDAEYAEEEIAEFGMLHFLDTISGFDSKFKQILLSAIEDVKHKQENLGVSHYGFGAELYYNYIHIEWERLLRDAHTLIGAGIQKYDELKKMLQTYPETSELNLCANFLYEILLTKNGASQLTRITPRLLNKRRIYGQVWTKSGKTNIVTRDNYLLFEENVDAISRLDIYRLSSDLYLIEDKGLFRIYEEKHGNWCLLVDNEFDDIKIIKYGNYYVIFVKRHCDGKLYMLSPEDIRRRDQLTQIFLDNCMSADEFTDIEDEDGKGLYIYSKTNNKFSYIFPFYRLRSRIVDDIDTRIVLHGGKQYQYPDIRYFTSCGQKFVYIVINGMAHIYHIEGCLIGKYNLFSVIDDDKYALIKINKKFNYFSFEKMGILFERWFEDCEYPEHVNGEWIFKVKEKGTCMILDEIGNDISNNYIDILKQWK